MPKLHGAPGQRLLWPSIATSVPLARCSLEAQLLFERLISQADDQGRLQGEPVLVRAACMPLVRAATTKRVERWIEELVEAELVIWYQAKGQWLIQLRNWWDHQSGQRWIYPSRWPPPKDWEDRAPKTPKPIDESLEQTASRRNGAGVTPESRQRDAGVIPDVGVGGGVGDRRSSTPKPPPSPVPRDAIALKGQTRPDLVALGERGMTYIRRSELDVLDHIADNERDESRPISVGQQVVADWIAQAPKGVHLVDFVIQRENQLKRERGASADEIEAEWAAFKERERQAAAELMGPRGSESLGSILDRLAPPATVPTKEASGA